MQKYETDKQFKASLEVKRYKNKKVPSKVLTKIRTRARQHWPEDYVMQLYEIEKQAAAYIAINFPSIFLFDFFIGKNFS